MIKKFFFIKNQLNRLVINFYTQCSRACMTSLFTAEMFQSFSKLIESVILLNSHQSRDKKVIWCPAQHLEIYAPLVEMLELGFASCRHFDFGTYTSTCCTWYQIMSEYSYTMSGFCLHYTYTKAYWERCIADCCLHVMNAKQNNQYERLAHCYR